MSRHQRSLALLQMRQRDCQLGGSSSINMLGYAVEFNVRLPSLPQEHRHYASLRLNRGNSSRSLMKIIAQLAQATRVQPVLSRSGKVCEYVQWTVEQRNRTQHAVLPDNAKTIPVRIWDSHHHN